MLRLSLAITGKSRVSSIGILTILTALCLDAALRNGYLPTPLGTSGSLASALFYTVALVVSVRILRRQSLEGLPQPEISDLGVLYILLYCILMVTIAVFVPGSSLPDQMCKPSERSFGLGGSAMEILLRLMGVLAVSDYLDARQLKRRGTF